MSTSIRQQIKRNNVSGHKVENKNYCNLKRKTKILIDKKMITDTMFTGLAKACSPLSTTNKKVRKKRQLINNFNILKMHSKNPQDFTRSIMREP